MAVFLLAVVALTALLGPQVEVSAGIGDLDASVPGISELDTSLADAEAAVPDLTPGTEKNTRWAGVPGARACCVDLPTRVFSIRQENRPLIEPVASAPGANLLYARLSGHGRTGEALAATSLPGG